MPYVVPGKPWEVVGADMFLFKNTTVHCRLLQEVLYCKKEADSLAADDLVKAAKIVFREFGLPKKITSMQA